MARPIGETNLTYDYQAPASQPMRRGAAIIPERGEQPTWSYGDLEAAFMKAHRAGDKERAGILAKAMQDKNYRESQNDLVSFAMGASQGMTLGFGDEAAAGIRAATEHVTDPFFYGVSEIFSPRSDTPEDLNPFERYMRGYRQRQEQFFPEVDSEETTWKEDFLKRYRNALGSGRGMLETARREDPVGTFTGELAGGLALGAPAAKGVTAGSGILKGTGKLMGLGTAEGATAAYGYSEADPLQAYMAGEDEERVMQEVTEAMRDVGFGGAIGLGGSMAVPLIASGSRAILRTIGKPFTKNARIKNDMKKAVLGAIEEDLERGAMTLDDAIAEIKSTPGMTIADIGEATRALTKQQAQQPYEGGRLIREWLEGRNREQWERMHPTLARALTGKEADNFAAARNELIAGMKRRGDFLYSQAFGKDIRVTPEMAAIINNPEFKPARDVANRLLRLDNMPELGDIKPGQLMNTEIADKLIQGMEDTVTEAYKTSRSIGNALKPRKNEFRDLVFDQNKTLQTARRQWAGDMRNNEAMDYGLKVFNDDADIVEEIVSEMSPGELQFFKMGALRAAMRKLGNKSDTSDLTKGIFDRPNARDAMRVAFGSDEKFREFMDFIAGEQKMFDTYKKALGGSDTVPRIMLEGMGGKLAALFGYTGAMATGTGMPPAITGYITRKAYETAVPVGRQMAQRRMQSQAMADMLRGTDIEGLMRPQTMGGLLGTDVPLSSAAGVTGLLGTSLPHPFVDSGL